jgi:fatty acid synthase
MTAVEIKQTLEREFEVYLTAQEIQNLTFACLEEMTANKQQTEVEECPSEGTQALFYSTILLGDTRDP